MKKKFPLNDMGLSTEEKIVIMDTITLLEDQLALVRDADFRYPELDFALFDHYHSVWLGVAYPVDGAAKKAHLTISEVCLVERLIKHGTRISPYYQLWGIAMLKNNFGHLVIRHEELVDKIQELLKPVELDFKEDPAFSSRFYVMANSQARAREHLNATFRQCIMDIPLNDFIIEIRKNYLLIGNRKPVQPDTAIAFIDFLKKVVEIE